MRRSHALVVLVAAALTAVGCSSSSSSSNSDATPKPSVSATSKTASPAPDSAAPSAAVINGTIVFRRYTDNTLTESQLVIAHLDGTHEKVLTNPGPGGTDTFPVWSPDGKTIAFSRTIPKTTCVIKIGCQLTEAFTVSPSGGQATQLTHSPRGVLCANGNIFSCNADPDFSPDGKHIVYDRMYATASSGGIQGNLWIANADGTDAHQLTNPKEPQNDASPVWAPDGKSIAFQRNAGNAPADADGSSIDTVSSDGTGLRQLTAIGLRLAVPRWSPDGSTILAYQDSTPGKFAPSGLYTIRPDGTGLRNLTGTSADLQYGVPAYSPDGRYIVVGRVQRGVNHNNAELWLLTATGTPIRNILPNPLWQSEARWDPATP